MAIQEKAEKLEFNEGDALIKEGDPGQSIMMILEGEVACKKGEKIVRILSQNDFLGESSLIFDLPRSLDVVALKKTIVYAITKEQFEETIGSDFSKQILSAILKNAFMNNSLLQTFSSHEVFPKIFQLFEVKHYEDDQEIDVELEKKLIYVLQGNMIGVYF